MRGAFGFQILNMPELQYAAPVMLSVECDAKSF
jgi:hypothetical protein